MMDKEKQMERLRALLEEGNSYSYDALPKGDHGYPRSVPLEWFMWVQRIQTLVKELFKADSAPSLLIQKGEKSANALVGNGPDKFDHAKACHIKALEEGLRIVQSDKFGELIGEISRPSGNFDLKKVFIVHGHNHEAKNELELFLSEIGLEPIVLHRQPDEGRTLIEKFEKYSKVGYAIILLTADDYVASSSNLSAKPEQRARQNVIFEFGFFVGQLGRDRVCCLHQDSVTLPSDLNGLVYKPFVKHIEEAKYSIIRELKAAGYDVTI